jgi:hypothetical protein
MPLVVLVHLLAIYLFTYLPIKRRNSFLVASDVRIEPSITEVIIDAFCF